MIWLLKRNFPVQLVKSVTWGYDPRSRSGIKSGNYSMVQVVGQKRKIRDQKECPTPCSIVTLGCRDRDLDDTLARAAGITPLVHHIRGCPSDTRGKRLVRGVRQ